MKTPTRETVRWGGLALALMVPALAWAWEGQPAYRALRASVVSWQELSGHNPSFHVVAQLANDSKAPVRFPGGIQFSAQYHPDAKSESTMAARYDSTKAALESVGKTHFRCGDLPEFPRAYYLSFVVGRDTTRVIAPGETFADTMSFQFDPAFHARWPGSIDIVCEVVVPPLHRERRRERYSPMGFTFSIPVP